MTRTSDTHADDIAAPTESLKDPIEDLSQQMRDLSERMGQVADGMAAFDESRRRLASVSAGTTATGSHQAAGD